ncbi:MAG TPA: hypothetical protein VF587_14815 [Solirubrobacteraceae bacterium]|jgi:uncharacterized PurR-regulated membrane protein YhhQ (DUF165 family)
MSTIDFLPYWIVGTVIVVSLLCPLFLGAQGFIATAGVLPFAIAYLLIDRVMRRREADAAH